MDSSAPRAILRLFLYLLLTIPLMPAQALLLALRSPAARRLPRAYHRICCRIFGIEVQVVGDISPERPTLFVANHISYLDIGVISAAVETCFVAKREIAGWPFFGWLAKLQETVFVERRATAVAGERDELARRLEQGSNVVLFAEGTSNDGNRLLPFKSALFSVAERTVQGAPLTVQPVTIAYTRLDGMPISRTIRPFVAWYGDMELVPHLWFMLGLGRLSVVLQFHDTVSLARFGKRRKLAAHCQAVITKSLEAANFGRPLPAARAASPHSPPGRLP
jgi:lyso-ornithine lipid O-acyltransferase